MRNCLDFDQFLSGVTFGAHLFLYILILELVMGNEPWSTLSRSRLLEVLRLKGTSLEKRISNLLIAQLRIGLITNEIHVEKVLDAIHSVESGSDKDRVKKEQDFRGEILKGYSKKHFFQSSFLGQNIINELKLHSDKSAKFERIYEEVARKYQTPEEIAAMLAHKMSFEAFEIRANKRKLTGEWIVFTEHVGEKYYLTIAFHHENDVQIKRRIITNCKEQFPFIPD